MALGSWSWRLTQRVSALRRRRWAALSVVQLRLLLGFAFLPAGLKKVLGQPFTDPHQVGPFHEFLHAFHATGFFYRFVGALQLLAAALLLSQRWGFAGAALLFPLLTAILVFCWSTAVYPTAIVVSLMFAGTCALLLWEAPRWLAFTDDERNSAPFIGEEAHYSRRVWQWCGASAASLYFVACALSGSVYRPRGADWGNVPFYALLVLPLCPLTALAIDRRRRRTEPERTSATREPG